jgi:hypothetical protein
MTLNADGEPGRHRASAKTAPRHIVILYQRITPNWRLRCLMKLNLFTSWLLVREVRKAHLRKLMRELAKQNVKWN